MRVRLLAIGISACSIFWVSIVGFVREKAAWRFLQFVGGVSLLLVVLEHIAGGDSYHPLDALGRERQSRTLPGSLECHSGIDLASAWILDPCAEPPKPSSTCQWRLI